MARYKIRVMLVDDHYVVRIGLHAVIDLEQDMAIVAEAEDGTEAVKLFAQHKPDVVLMDLRMPGFSGIETAERIRKDFPNARILMLTTFDGDEDIYRAMEVGAYGYLLKNAPRPELLAAIRHVHSGKQYLPANIARSLAERDSSAPLTEREIEALQLASKGCSNKEIASVLAITEHTAKAHMKHILEKLGVEDRTGAVTLALRRGIIHLEE